MPKVKICGITNLEDALAALFSQADAIGFVFYKKSPRYIDPLKARNISRILPKKLIRVGVFVDEDKNKIKRIAKACALDILQFHGNESAEFCQKFKGYKIIKAFRVKDKIDLNNILSYKTFGYLFDTFVKSKRGGTGKKFNWLLLKKLNSLRKPIFLSGGLGLKNVRQALKQARPDWIDVSSSVEIKPGRKDHKKLKKFIAIVRKFNQAC